MYDFSKRSKGLLCRRVKLNNDSSCSISIDFSKIFCIVQPNENRNQLQLTLISLKKETQGQILWIKDCTSDYLSCSLRYVLLLSFDRPINSDFQSAWGLHCRRNESPISATYKRDPIDRIF